MIRYIHPRYLTIFVALLLLAAGCSGAGKTQTAGSITVEGAVERWGNEPVTALVLKTDQDTYYILDLDEEDAAILKQRTYGSYRVSGQPYAGLWQGEPFTHLTVTTVTPL